MTTHSDERPEGWKPVAPMDGCTFSGYQASDKGHARSIDRKQGNRQLRGKQLALRPHDDGYMLVNLRCDSADPAHSRVHTFAVHKVVLYTFAGEPAPGQEACHSPRGPAFNWWPEGVRWDTKKANAADKPEPSVLPEPSHPCLNAPACPNLVRNPGRRCLDCVAEVGRLAADMLRDRRNLQEVAEHFGYQTGDWVYKLAVEHGGYAGSKAEARTQGQHVTCTCPDCQRAPEPPSRRVTFRRWLRSVMYRGE